MPHTRSCVFEGCTHKITYGRLNTKPYSCCMHRFPRETNWRYVWWIAKCKPTRKSLLNKVFCTCHFQEKYQIKGSKRTWLLADAIPGDANTDSVPNSSSTAPTNTIPNTENKTNNINQINTNDLTMLENGSSMEHTFFRLFGVAMPPKPAVEPNPTTQCNLSSGTFHGSPPFGMQPNPQE